MAYIGEPSRVTWPGDRDAVPLGLGEPAAAPRCAAAELDVFLLDSILKRLTSQPTDSKLLDLRKRAVESTIKALPTFVEQGCCEPHLKTLENDVQNLPWQTGHDPLRKRLVDAIRGAQKRARKDFKHC